MRETTGYEPFERERERGRLGSTLDSLALSDTLQEGVHGPAHNSRGHILKRGDGVAVRVFSQKM